MTQTMMDTIRFFFNKDDATYAKLWKKKKNDWIVFKTFKCCPIMVYNILEGYMFFGIKSFEQQREEKDVKFSGK